MPLVNPIAFNAKDDPFAPRGGVTLNAGLPLCRPDTATGRVVSAADVSVVEGFASVVDVAVGLPPPHAPRSPSATTTAIRVPLLFIAAA